MSELPKKQKKAYLKQAERIGRQCPFCGSYEVSAGATEPGELWIRVDIECQKCGDDWTEVYKLVDVEGHDDDD